MRGGFFVGSRVGFIPLRRERHFENIDRMHFTDFGSTLNDVLK